MFFKRENGDLINLSHFSMIPAHIEGSSMVWVLL
ncbi:hypothetical protein LCGC14_1388150, partial [marine sediment metagenome]